MAKEPPAQPAPPQGNAPKSDTAPAVPDDKRPLRTELTGDKPEDLNPAESRPTLSRAVEPPGPDKDQAATDPGGWPAKTFDADGQVGTPGGPPYATGVVPVPPEPGGRDPAVEKLLREGVRPDDPRGQQAHPVTPGDPPGRADTQARREAEAQSKRDTQPAAPGPEAKNDKGDRDKK